MKNTNLMESEFTAHLGLDQAGLSPYSAVNSAEVAGHLLSVRFGV
jgi:4-hydroxy-3-methylbut-2-en-1-yl diphosphate synthase IspG/GcpE